MKAKKLSAVAILSCLLLICMLISMLPMQVLAAEPASHEHSEEIDLFSPADDAETVVELSEDSTAITDFVTVNVTAQLKSTGAAVPVPGATVRLFVDGVQIRTAIADASGQAKISLAGLTYEQKERATISADTIVSRGKAINGTGRDALYEKYYPKTVNPLTGQEEYYRYTMELHSETIDKNGNWLGADIPAANITNKVDMVFALDTTGSMGDEIDNVKRNLKAFAQALIEQGLDIRFCVIEYLDITNHEMTYVHTAKGSRWYSDTDTVVSVIDGISLGWGADEPETAIDALGAIADAEAMSYRSDAHKFAFLLTDASYKVNNLYGYTSLQHVSDALAEQNIITSVISPSSYKSTYQRLFNTTGGTWINIYSSDFKSEMLKLANSVATSVERPAVNLTLSEPRMLVNFSVAYFGNDKESRSDEYRDSIKAMLSEYSQQLAQTTDGHVYIDNVLIMHTSNRLDFYNPKKLISMCDLRIETETDDDGKWNSNVTIHNNAYTNAFYSDQLFNVNGNYMEQFKNLKNPNAFLGRQTFGRIQSGAIDINNHNMIDDPVNFALTQVHETGHYLLGFLDEYLDPTSQKLSDSFNYGLMDWQYDDSEMSKASDYSTAVRLNTLHYFCLGVSCEETLAQLLTTGTNSYNPAKNDRYYYYDLPDSGVFVDNGGSAAFHNYKIKYTASSTDRLATYPYAALTESDFIYETPGGNTDTLAAGDIVPVSDFDSVIRTSDALADVLFAGSDEYIEVMLAPQSGYRYSLYVMQKDAHGYVEVALMKNGSDYLAEIEAEMGEVVEVKLVAEKDGVSYSNTYYVDRSGLTDTGYIYSSIDNAVLAYVISDDETSYTFTADNTAHVNGEYLSVNQATMITSDYDVSIESGEIYSVASYRAEIDYTTLSWFRYHDGVWTQLPSDLSVEENMNLGARADIVGEGLYVLMAKEAPVGGADTPVNLRYKTSTTQDALVIVSFDDSNVNSKYYNLYYSDSEFTDKNAEGVLVRSFDAESTDLNLNLIERGRAVYVAIEVVLENGTRSELSEIIRVVAGEADSDGDGIPDWYCDKYSLWGKPGEHKNIAASDDDGDGLTNLEEYLGGSNPLDPNDPVHTTLVPVDGVTVSDDTVHLSIGGSHTVTATVLPENATNKNVTWSVQNPSIVSIATDGNKCTITARANGTTQVYVVTADGGFSAVVTVTVSSHTHTNNLKRYMIDGDTHTSICDTCDAPFRTEAHVEITVGEKEASCDTIGYTGDVVCDVCGHEISKGHDIDPQPHQEIVLGAKDATCTEEGYTGDIVCKKCHLVIDEGTSIPKTGHTSKTIGFKYPTCTESGYTGDVICSSCKQLLSPGSKLLPLPHDEQILNEKPASCTEEGYTGDVFCKKCEQIVSFGHAIPVLEHTVETIHQKPAGCTEEGYTGDVYCSTCEQIVSFGKVIPPLGHAPVLTGEKPATCTEEGYTGDEVCEACGIVLSYGHTIETIPHTTVTLNQKDATCTEEGYTGDVVCTECNTVLVVGEIISKTAHNETLVDQKDATCTEEGYTGDVVCADCHAVLTSGETIEKKPHAATLVGQKAATCTEQGYTGDTVCADCGVVIETGSAIALLPHNQYTVDAKDATCTKEGYTGDVFCSDCGNMIEKGHSIPVQPHTSKVINATDATCTKDGYSGDTVCSVCDMLIIRGHKISKLSHTLTVINQKDSTCAEEGYTGDTWCSVCKTVITKGQTITKKAHTLSIVGQKDATCVQEGYTGDSYCSACQTVVAKGQSIAKKAHTLTTINQKDATCVEEGYTGDSFCSACDSVITEGKTIAKIAHTLTTINAKEPSCAEQGYTGDRFCTACQTVISTGTAIKKDPHTAPTTINQKDATCSEEGYTGDSFCPACQTVIAKGQTIEKIAHTLTTINQKDATCAEEGYTGDSFCSACDAIITKGQSIEKIAHTLTIINQKDATCSEEGYTGDSYCSSCNTTVQAGAVIDKIAHEAILINQKDATCSEEGYTGDQVCKDCGISLVAGNATEKLPHTETVVGKVDPVEFKDGYTGDTVCSVCGQELAKGEVIPGPEKPNTTTRWIVFAGIGGGALIAAVALVYFISKARRRAF